MAASKIRIKMGEVEVEFEGTESFLKIELKELLAGVLELHKKADLKSTTLPVSAKETTASPSTEVAFSGTTNSVAAKLGSKTGPDLIIAAITRGTLLSDQETCNRNTIIKEMQAGTSYYKKGYLSNLTASLKGLLKDQKIREISTGVYALSASELHRVKGLLAN